MPINSVSFITPLLCVDFLSSVCSLALTFELAFIFIRLRAMLVLVIILLLTILLSLTVTGILRYKIDLTSIQMMLDDDYYDNENYDLDDY